DLVAALLQDRRDHAEDPRVVIDDEDSGRGHLWHSIHAMMTFFTEDHDLFRKSFREFVEKELRPYTDEWERAELFPREIFKRMGELGYLGLSFPEELGGGGGELLGEREAEVAE